MTSPIILRIVSFLLAIILALGLSPLLDGVGRKIKARIQYRMGPPVLQTAYDLSKLLRTPSLVVGGKGFIIAPYIALTSALLSITILPIGGISPISFSYDIFVFLYVLAMVSIAFMMAGFSVNNTYANIGANREMMLILSVEPVLGLALAILALLTGSLNIEGIIGSIRLMNPMYIPLLFTVYAILAYIVYVEGGFIPFDVAEAETEILEGPLCEYSGRLLGVFKWALLIKRLTLVWLLSSLIIVPLTPYPTSIPSYIFTLTLQLLLTLVIYSVIAANEAHMARYKIDWIISLNKYVFLAVLVLFIVTMVVRL